MSTLLQPHLPLAADETALSWAARLAAAHTGGRVAGFLRDMDIDRDAFLRGEEAALARLARLGGEPFERVAAAAIRRGEDGLLRLRGQRFSHGFTTDPATVFCPRCLAEDEAAGGTPSIVRRGRLIWKLRPVRVCPTHRVALIRRAPEDWEDKFHELSVRVPERGAALARLAEAAAEAAPSPLQDYVVGWLAGRAGPAWLDGQTIEQAVLASEWLGLALAFGPLPAVMDADAAEAAVAGLRRTVSVVGLRDLLNCSRPMAEQIVATGLLEPVAGAAAARRGNKRCSVDRAQVDRFLDRLSEAAPEVAVAPDGYVPLEKAAERSRSTSVTLLRGILDGSVAGAVSVAGARGIKALRVPRESLPAPARTHESRLPICAVFARLRLSHAAGEALLAARDDTGAPFLAVEEIKRGRRRVRLVRLEDLDAFTARFATIAQLCRETGQHHQTLRRDLDKRGVSPALHVPRLRLRLYRRADLPWIPPDRQAA